MEIQWHQYNVAGFNAIPMSLDLYAPKSDQALAVVIYAHGINGFKDWGGMDLIAEHFAQAGIAFLKFNFSHNGTTPARPEEFFDLEAYQEDSYLKRQFDLKQILSFIENGHPEVQLDLNRIYLIGHSRGGADAILLASQDARIKKLITWASTSHAQTPWKSLSFDELKDWKEKGLFTRKNSRTQQDLPISYSLYEEYQANKQLLNIEERAREVKQDWLIIHGDEDEAVFIKEAYDLKSWNPEARVKVIEGTGHTFDRTHPWEAKELPTASLELVQASLQFLLD